MRTLKPALDRITRIMAELALDDVERHALAGELDGVGVAQLVGREAAPDAGLGGEPAELDSPRWRSTMVARGSGQAGGARGQPEHA